MQNYNLQEAVTFGINRYKIGDPVLFSDVKGFSPYIYNGMKGKILDIKNKSNEEIVFEIQVEKIEQSNNNFEIINNISNDFTIIRFSVFKENPNTKEDKNIIVPFQIAYAISIHKAQGLEYKSVK